MMRRAISTEDISSRPNPIPRHLRPREVLNIRDGLGLTVRCRAGSLWITQYGDCRDVVLEADECFVLDRPGLALVSAPIGPATAVVEEATPGVCSGAAAKAPQQGIDRRDYRTTTVASPTNGQSSTHVGGLNG